MPKSAPLRRLLHNLQPWLALHLIFGAGIVVAASDCKNQQEAEGYIGNIVSFQICTSLLDPPYRVLIQDKIELYSSNTWNEDWLWLFDRVPKKLHIFHRVRLSSVSATVKWLIPTIAKNTYYNSKDFDLDLTNRGYPVILFQLLNDELSLNDDAASNVLSCGTKQSPEIVTICKNLGEKIAEGAAVKSGNSSMHDLVYDLGAVECNATGMYQCEATFDDGLIQKESLNITHHSCPPIFGRASLNISDVEIGKPVSVEVLVFSANRLDLGYSKWLKDGVPQNETGPNVTITREDWQIYTVSWIMTPQNETDLETSWELTLMSIYGKDKYRRDYYGSFKFDLNTLVKQQEEARGPEITTPVLMTSTTSAEKTEMDINLMVIGIGIGGGLLLVSTMIMTYKYCRSPVLGYKPDMQMEEVPDKDEVTEKDIGIQPETVTHEGETTL